MSDCYPGKLQRWSFDHKGGTKSYHITQVLMANGNSAVFYRYGKKDAPGQASVDLFVGEDDAIADFSPNKAVDKKIRDKEAGGYQQVAFKHHDFESMAKLKALIGPIALPVFIRACGHAFAHLDSEYEQAAPTTVSDPYVNEKANEASAKRHRDAQARTDMARMIAEQKAEDEAKQLAEMRARNSNWGKF